MQVEGVRFLTKFVNRIRKLKSTRFTIFIYLIIYYTGRQFCSLEI